MSTKRLVEIRAVHMHPYHEECVTCILLATNTRLMVLLREGRELAQHNLRKASQRTALWHWGDRVEAAIDEPAAPPGSAV